MRYWAYKGVGALREGAEKLVEGGGGRACLDEFAPTAQPLPTSRRATSGWWRADTMSISGSPGLA